MGFDRQSDRFYLGKNSDTVIYRFAADGDKVESFSFTGARHPVSETDKRNHIAGFDIPDEAVASMIEALPDQMGYYNRIQVVDGLVYLFSAENIDRAQTGQIVNVFSSDGRHLYCGQIQVEEGRHIYGSPENMQLPRGFVYAVQENEAGDKRIVKYTIALLKPRVIRPAQRGRAEGLRFLLLRVPRLVAVQRAR